MSGKPIIFVSSTIYDFRDLRSALKFWLEELGYEVMLSDFNDFTKPLDENSYTACLKAIERASYFILLIGARTGGLFDPEKNISITRMEYRTAYDLVKARRMKLISFVREDLWNAKEDRKALRDLLISHYAKQKELNDSDVELITKHSSAFVNDANAAFSFLREVARVDEMKKGSGSTTKLPIANWIHPFSSFQDIADTLSTILNTKRDLATIALSTNLKREFLSNLTQLISKGKDGKIFVNTFWAEIPRTRFNDDLGGSSTMPARYVKWLVMYLIGRTSGRQLSTQFVDQALTSGAFLEYDFNLNSYSIGIFHKSLFQLKENINRLKEFSTGHIDERLDAFIDEYAPINNPIVNSDRDITVSNKYLLAIFARYDCEQNIANLCVGLLKAMDGDPSKLVDLKLNRSTPSQTEASKIEAESPTVEELEAWLHPYS